MSIDRELTPEEALEAKMARKAARKAEKRRRESSEDSLDAVLAGPKSKKVATDSAAFLEAYDAEKSESKSPKKDNGTIEVKKDEGAPTAAAFCKEHNLLVESPNSAGFICPPPMSTFQSTPFASKLVAKMTAEGFTGPTTTQAMAWPLALGGMNCVTVAKTGSGKTLGFLLPIFHMLKNGKPTAFSGSVARPAVLVLAPTRELACQIEEEAVKFGQPLGLRSVCVYGGAPKSGQLRLLRGGIDIIVGTPGRLQDFLNMGVISLSGTRFLVLDEADRMLDMGFEQDLRAIVDTLPTTRQTLFFTATWPKAVEKLAAEFAPKPVRMSVGSTDTLSANINITQHIHIVSGEHAKTDKLRALLTQLFIVDSKVQKGHGKCIVFCKFKNACNKIAEEIYNAGFSVNTLHGDMDQYERTQVIGQFRTGELRVLVATDVAARGLDVKDVSDVVNFDFPFGRNGVEDYVHRIGRTGRAGALGSAHTFFDPREDGKNAGGLVELLVGAKQKVPDELRSLVRSSGGGRSFGGGGGFRGGRSFGGRGGRGGGGGFRGGNGGGRRW